MSVNEIYVLNFIVQFFLNLFFKTESHCVVLAALELLV